MAGVLVALHRGIDMPHRGAYPRGMTNRTYKIERPGARSRVIVRTYEDGVEIEWSSFVASFDAEGYVRDHQAFDAVAHEWGC